jgi:trehalose 6-phosphate synthase/phosphatase
LILSEFAGTYGSFGAAIRINPWDYRETADAINEALTILDEDATTRWNELFKNVTTHSAQFWTESFITELEKVHSDMQRRFSIHIPHLNPKSFEDAFHKAEKRLILLDYDGTLVPYEKGNISDRPPQEYVKIMKKLCSNPKNQVYVMSSRTRKSLDERLGDIPGLGLSAENGAFLKPIGGDWESLFSDVDMEWRDQVQEIFDYYAERTPGSYIEMKDVSIVWHYRSADNQNYGAWQAAECQNHIEDALGTIYSIHAVVGNKKIEVMPRNINKAVAVSRILLAGVPDFILAIGDDRTDEDMFNYVNKLENVKTKITCTVGSKSSEASYFISGVMGVVTCLDILASEE